MSVLLTILLALSPISLITLSITGFFWGFWIVLFNILPVRRWLISRHILTIFAKNSPHFSASEEAVLAAGDIGWEQELFSGMPDLNKLIALPPAKLTNKEQLFLSGPIAQLCALIDAWQINSEQYVPPSIWQYLKKHGFFGLVIPEEYGGQGFSAFAHSQVIMKIASVSTAVATIVSVPNSLGPGELILHYGSVEQKNYYLPRLASGEETPCFALTSLTAGSDAGAIIDYGIVCRFQKNGQEVLGIRLNWDKRYITLAPVATLLGLAFKLYDPERLLGDREKLGICCALVSVHAVGVKIGRYHNPLNCAFPNGPTQGIDVYIELNGIIGGEKQIGKGWQMLMERLAAGRGISLPAIALGGAKIAAAASGGYARIRRQFNTFIGDFGGIQECLGSLAGDVFIAEALRLFNLSQLDQGIHSTTSAAISKFHVTELGRKIIRKAMDIHGGKGICLGPHNYLGQLYIESPIAITVEGANILTRSLIIFGQGSLRCHPFLLTEMTAAKQKNIKEFDRSFFAHMGYFISNKIRTMIFGLTRGFWLKVPVGPYRRYYQKLMHFSAVFALIVDILLITTGSGLKRKEQLSGRLGDLLSYLYMVSAILKYAMENQDKQFFSAITVWSCQEIFARFESILAELLENLPNRLIASILNITIFPWGRKCKKPSDELTLTVAKQLMEPDGIRKEFLKDLYLSDILALIEKNIEKFILVEPLLKKIYHGKHQHQIDGRNLSELINAAINSGLLNEMEAGQIREAERVRVDILKVDDFAKENDG